MLATMQPGDPIACKSLTTRATGLPFFTGDNPASVMTIHATGAVRSVDPESGAVVVDWAAGPDEREWYFWTGVAALWKVTAGGSTMGDQMLEFTFNRAQQDLLSSSPTPTGSPGSRPSPGFSWIPFYEEIATRLLQFREDGRALG